MTTTPNCSSPEGSTGPAARQADKAKLVCLPCPVRARCLGFALRHGLGYGIWGGTTPAERRFLRQAAVS